MNSTESNIIIVMALAGLFLATCYMAGKDDAQQVEIQSTKLERLHVLCHERGYDRALCDMLMGGQ